MKTCLCNAENNRNRRMKPVFTGILILWAAFWMSSPAAGDTPKPAGTNAATVTIKGSISNIDEIGAYVVNESFLQLYPCETTGRINFRADKQGKPVQPVVPPGQQFYLDGMGRLVPPSGLPRTIFPDFGFFSFDKVQGLTSGGCYKVCVKMLGSPYPGFVPLIGPDGKIHEIIIPEIKASASPQDIVIDLSKEPLMIPDPANLPQDSYKTVNPPAVKDSGADFWK